MGLKERVKENLAYFDQMAEKLLPSRCRLLLKLDMLWCAFRHGASPKNYFWFDFWRYNERERAAFMTDLRISRFIKKNNTGDRSVFNNKAEFNKRFSGFVIRPWRSVCELTPLQLKAFIDENGSVIFKPCEGSCGEGVERIESEAVTDIEHLHSSHSGCLVEGCIRQHPDIAAFNPSCVNTVRAITYLCSDGKPRIAAAALRIGAEGSVADNMAQGGYCCEIDVKTGVIRTAAISRTQDRYLFSPVTGSRIIGAAIPHWEELRAKVLEAAARVPNIRYSGWDIAITPDGVDFIEGNIRSSIDLLQMPAKVGRRDIEAAARLNDR